MSEEQCLDEADRKESASLHDMSEQEYCLACAFSNGCRLNVFVNSEPKVVLVGPGPMNIKKDIIEDVVRLWCANMNMEHNCHIHSDHADELVERLTQRLQHG